MRHYETPQHPYPDTDINSVTSQDTTRATFSSSFQGPWFLLSLRCRGWTPMLTVLALCGNPKAECHSCMVTADGRVKTDGIVDIRDETDHRRITGRRR